MKNKNSSSVKADYESKEALAETFNVTTRPVFQQTGRDVRKASCTVNPIE